MLLALAILLADLASTLANGDAAFADYVVIFGFSRRF